MPRRMTHLLRRVVGLVSLVPELRFRRSDLVRSARILTSPICAGEADEAASKIFSTEEAEAHVTFSRRGREVERGEVPRERRCSLECWVESIPSLRQISCHNRWSCASRAARSVSSGSGRLKTITLRR